MKLVKTWTNYKKKNLTFFKNNLSTVYEIQDEIQPLTEKLSSIVVSQDENFR